MHGPENVKNDIITGVLLMIIPWRQ